MEGAVNLAISQSTHSVIPAYDFASALALSKSEYPCGAKAGIHLVFCGNYLPSSIKIKMDSRLRENDGKEK